jgi:hypothetical protein
MSQQKSVKQHLQHEAIRHACSDISFVRGRSYFDEGKVLSLSVDEESENHARFHSSIKGRAAAPYQQDVKLTYSALRNDVEIDGRCSCPMHYNCKHVAAACLKFLNEDNPQGSAAASTQQCFAWLEQLQHAQQRPHTGARQGSFLTYVLTRAAQESEIFVELLVTSRKKSGGLSRGKQILLRSIFLGYSRPDYLQDEDEEIIRLLKAARSSYYGHPLIVGATGYLLMQELLRSGRCFWGDLERAPLHGGAERSLHIAWKGNHKGEYRLDVTVAPQGLPLLCDPLLYVDPEEGEVGPLNGSMYNASQLQLLLEAPTISPEHADEFSRRLLIDAPELHIPPPKAVTIRDIVALKPQPLLTLYAEKFDGQLYHLANVRFLYGNCEISPLLELNPVVIDAEEGIVRLTRSVDAEEQALQQLADSGLTMAGEFSRDQLVLCYAEESQLEEARKWYSFLEEEIPRLQRRGWRIEQMPSFQLNFHDVDAWHADIKEEGNNWFDLSFDITVSGSKMPMLPLVTQLLENYALDALPDTLTVLVGENDYLKLPSATVKPVLETLQELYDSSPASSGRSVRLSLFDAARLAEMESGGLFSISGGKTLRELGRKLVNFTGIASVKAPLGLKAELRSYQQLGLNWLQFLREYGLGGVLADDMGLGKTIQSLAHLLLEKESGRMTSPCLIIAPTSLMGNWRREARRFTPDLSILTLQGSDRHRYFDAIGEYDLVLTTYPLLSRDGEVLQRHNYHYLILDEAQIIKNPRAKSARLVRALDASHRLCLTGTPMENHLGELWALFDFLMPGFLGNQQFFNRRYRTPIEKHGDGDMRRLLSKRVKPFMLRRTKLEVENELPPKTEMIRSIPLGKRQATLYESIRLSMESRVRQTIQSKGLARSHITILDALLKLRQCCCDPALLSLQQAKQVQESAKLELLLELLPELLEEGRRVLLFSQFTSMLAIIEEQLQKRKISYAKLTGQTRKRDEVIESFLSGEVDLFLISLKAGGVGLNLTAADTVILYDPWWNPAVETQAMDRAHRIGQENPVFVYKLITENTVEEKILAMQEKKRSLAAGIYDGGSDQGQLQLTAEELSELFTAHAE